jgi:hypothetical protein
MVNHSSRHPNARPTKKIIEDNVHILIIAVKEIQAGQEILFDYGDSQSTLPDCVPGCPICFKEGRVIMEVCEACTKMNQVNKIYIFLVLFLSVS